VCAVRPVDGDVLSSLPPTQYSEPSVVSLWYCPVPTASDLPSTNLRNGQLCLVIDEGSVYEVSGGVWTEMVSGTVFLD